MKSDEQKRRRRDLYTFLPLLGLFPSQCGGALVHSHRRSGSIISPFPLFCFLGQRSPFSQCFSGPTLFSDERFVWFLSGTREREGVTILRSKGDQIKSKATHVFFFSYPRFGEIVQRVVRSGPKSRRRDKTPEQGTFPPPIGAGSLSVFPCENPRRCGVFSVLTFCSFLFLRKITLLSTLFFFSCCYRQMQQEIGFNLLRFIHS